MDITLYEQVKNLYINYLEIMPVHTLNNFTYEGGGEDGTAGKDKRNNREVREGNRIFI